MYRGSGALSVVLAVVLAAACSSKSEVKGGGGTGKTPEAVPQKPTFTVFALAEVRGQIGPCGCTSDPLGDISRTTQLIVDARKSGPVLVIDAGSLLYSKDPIPAHLAAQEELKADLLATVYQQNMQVAALGLGPADMVKGPDKIRLPRIVANLPADLKLTAAGAVLPAPRPDQPTPSSGAPAPMAAPDTTKPAGSNAAPAAPAAPPAEHASGSATPARAGTVVDIGGAQVGIFGVIDEGAVKSLAVTDPVAAGKAAVADLKKQGAQLIVALVQVTSKRDAVRLAREIGGIDVTVAGLGAVAPEPENVSPEADKIGTGWLVIPGNRGQVVSRIDITVRPGGGPLADAIGKGAAQGKIAQIDRQLATLDGVFQKFAEDKTADPAFVKQKQAERDALVADRKQLEAQPLVVPASGSYFTLDQVRINKTLACSVPVREAIKSYDAAAGQANVAAAAGKLPPPPAKGKAGYVGNEACSDCHQEAVDFWKTTVHASAWKTLVDRGQQYDYECTGCHVTGWEKPGGSNMAKTEGLVDVGCETCHGPGSIHVAKGGEEKPLAIVRTPPEDLCATQCHTKEHSDTFERTAYLRDILGTGHGADARKALGDGPTGHSLRSAALDKAGRELGANCMK
jgi:hypothetical protein